MPKENNKMQVDIENLFKQNVNDLLSIKELYKKLKEVDKKISQIKYIDSNLANKLKKEYENLKKIILDENVQAKLTNDINTINSHLVTNMNELDKKVNKKIDRIEVEANYAKKSEIGQPTQEQVDNWFNNNPQATTTVQDKSITNVKLADSYIYRGVVTSGSVNDCLKDGLYYIGSGVSDNPLGAKPSFLINKNVDSRIYQIIFTHSDSINKYERITLKTTDNLNDKSKWLKLNIPKETDLPLKGKKIVHFGDSILQYGNYPNKISEITGAITYNCGIGGGTLATHPMSNYEPLSLVNLVDNIVAGDFTTAIEAAENLYIATKDDKREVISLLSSIDFNDIDIITIAYGTNDFGNKVILGEPNSEEKTTFNGALNYVIKTLMTKYPNIKIYLFTPIYRTKLGSTGFEDSLSYIVTSSGLKLLDYVDSVIARGQERGCPVYDAFRNMGINYYNSQTYLKDGLHPNEYGDNRLADNYSKFLISN